MGEWVYRCADSAYEMNLFTMAVDDDVLGSDETHESSASLYTVEDCFELLSNNRGMFTTNDTTT